MRSEGLTQYLSAVEIDFLRLDIQSATPTEYSLAANRAKEIQTQLRSMLGQYLNPEIVDANRDLEQRLLICDSIDDTPYKRHGYSRASELGLDGFACNYSGLIYIERIDTTEVPSFNIRMKDPNKGWETIEEYYKVAYDLLNWQLESHEIVHKLQADDVPPSLHEMTGMYFEKRVMKEIAPGFVYTPVSEALSEGYEELLDRFGDEILQVSFGTFKGAQKRRNKIFDTADKVVSRKIPGVIFVCDVL